MRISFASIIFLSAVAFMQPAWAAKTYSQKLCNNSQFNCIKITKNQTWETLFPDATQRDVVMRLNRINIPLHSGMTLAIPKDLATTQVMDIAPFSKQIPSSGEKLIVVNPSVLAFGAYDPDGRLVWWGPISGGKHWCPDTGRDCKTISGSFEVYRKGGPNCASSKYPIPRGGAPMPYCMFFKGGYALHASSRVPGFHDSHGCVRLFYNDAQWLSKQFVDYGTTVIVHPYEGELPSSTDT